MNARRILIALAVTVAMAGLAEVAAGKWFGGDPLDRLNLRRDFTALAEGFSYQRDHWGFRGNPGAPAGISVVTVGGAFTDQPHLPEPQTWQAAMAEALAEEGHAAIVANAGIDGLDTQGLIPVLEEWLPRVPGFQPHFVVVMPDDGGAKKAQLDYGGPRAAANRSGLVRLWRRIAGPPRLERLDYQLPPPETAVFREQLRTIALLSHQIGAAPVLVTRPSGRFNAATLGLCREEGLLCLDLAGQALLGDGDLTGAGQPTAQGAAKIGRWLAAKLAGLV